MSRKVRIDPLVYPLWAFLLLAVPLKFLIGWLGAVICHEMGHITAQYILGGRPGMLCIGPTGAVIEGEDLGFCKNILCVMAGPVIGAFPVLFMRSFPEFAVCAFLLTAYNLIPLYPLDGGRVIYLLGQKYAVILSFKDFELSYFHVPSPSYGSFLQVQRSSQCSFSIRISDLS